MLSEQNSWAQLIFGIQLVEEQRLLILADHVAEKDRAMEAVHNGGRASSSGPGVSTRMADLRPHAAAYRSLPS